MPNESGDMKLLGNFRKLIDRVSAEPNYSPSNDAVKPPNLETQYAAALAATEDISTKMAPAKVAVNERQFAFEALGAVVMRARNMLKASGADKKILDDAETSVRKLLGRRKSAKVKDDPNTPANEAAANHSAAQLSFENRVGNFDSFVAILKSVSEYKPNENDLKVASLQTLSDGLKSKNNAVSSTFVPLSQARGTRDQLLYSNGDCVVNTAALVKAYVSAAFGNSSQLYKQIKGLEFKRRSKG